VLWNGQLAVIDMAVRALDHPLTTRYRKTLILGALREDVGYLPGLGRVVECLSITHFYQPGVPGGFVPLVSAGPRRRANRLVARAVGEHRAGRVAESFVRLGRAAHLVTDMACPAHAHRTVHMIDDPFEWYVEGNAPALRALPVAVVPVPARPADLVESLARHTQRFPPDGTHSPWGRWLFRLGLREKLTARTLAEQARALIPLAAGHVAALLRLFLRDARVSG
jgi:hypothetical protein